MSSDTNTGEDLDKTVVPVRRDDASAARSAGAPDDTALERSLTQGASLASSASLTGTSGAPPTGTGTLGRSDSRLLTEVNTLIADALIEEEGTRAHSFSAIIAAAALLVSFALPLLGGDRTARHLAQFGLAAVVLGSLYVFMLTREARRYSARVHRGYGLLIGTFVGFIEYYLGLFSPMPVVLTLGLLFVGQSADRIGGVVIPVYVIIRWFVLATLVGSGVLPDVGLVTASGTPMTSRVFMVLAVTMILAFTLRMARVSRASLNDALQKAQDAILLAHQRDAQLDEARQNLDRALRAVVGKQGRYSGASAGGYRLAEVIGVGAMGEVYAALGADEGPPVAVKLMQAEAGERDDLVERFLREGEICQKLKSPHVVRVLDVGRMNDGSPYMAMERLYGDDLATRLRHEGNLELADVAELARDMAAGLDEAHRAGIVHRDLKPQNIFHAEVGVGQRAWKILDFGVSKLGGSSGTLTRAEVVGTPGYMSPEQARGREVDARSDVFSMAVVLYRAATGQPAFNGRSVPEKLFEIVYKMPEAPTQVRPELPGDVELVLAIALSKNATERFESAGALAKAFIRATRRELPRALRDRGRELQQKSPWGSNVAPS